MSEIECKIIPFPTPQPNEEHKNLLLAELLSLEFRARQIRGILKITGEVDE